MTKQQVLNSFKALSQNEQLDLFAELWEIVNTEMDVPLTDSLRTELDRRFAEADANPTPAEDFEVVREKLLRGEI